MRQTSCEAAAAADCSFRVGLLCCLLSNVAAAAAGCGFKFASCRLAATVFGCCCCWWSSRSSLGPATSGEDGRDRNEIRAFISAAILAAAASVWKFPSLFLSLLRLLLLLLLLLLARMSKFAHNERWPPMKASAFGGTSDTRARHEKWPSIHRERAETRFRLVARALAAAAAGERRRRWERTRQRSRTT